MPPNTVYVGRPGKHGNPFKIGDPHPVTGEPMDAEDAVQMFEWGASYMPADTWDDLRNKDLACWCPLDAPCHADVLLRLANR